MAQMMKGGGGMKMGPTQQQQPTQILQKPQGGMIAPAAGMPGTIVIPQGMMTSAPNQPSMSTHMAGGMSGMDAPNLIMGGMTSINGNSAAMATNNATSMDQDGATNLANTKEKTPMCLVNELARYNKIQHQYTLTDEQGPAHKKTFFVKLKLGEEEYAASGPSIKKAQHAAAAIALETTQHRHPPMKTTNLTNSNINATITPTVELNALAMKRGEPAIYRPIEHPGHPGGYYQTPPNYDFRGMYNQRYHYPRMPRIFYVSLKVGQREFIGQGPTRQAARHNAAAKALKVVQTLPMPDGMVAEKGNGGSGDSADGTSGMVTDSSGGITSSTDSQQQKQLAQDHGDHTGADDDDYNGKESL